MAGVQTTQDLIALLNRNGWSTAAFKRHLDDDAPWPVNLRSHCRRQQQQQQQQYAPSPTSQRDLHQQPQQLSPDGASPGSSAAAAVAAVCEHPQQPLLRISDVVAREAAIAYGKIRRYVRHTPLEPCPWLSGLAGPGRSCTALLKLESEQHTGSFKVRGALTKLLSLTPETLSRGVFTASTGNHALAVLYACTALSSSSAAATTTTADAVAPPADGDSLPSPAAAEAAAVGSTATAGIVTQRCDGGGDDVGGQTRVVLRPQLYVPVTASPYKVGKLRSLLGAASAELHLVGSDCLTSETAARAAAEAAGAVYVSPYNDPWVMAGQGTLALELLAARRRGQLDTVLVPVGGGGLIGGVASVLKAADPGIRVVGCQPAASDVMARSVIAGAIVPELDEAEGDGSAAAAAAAAAAAGGTLSDATAGGVEADSATLQPCVDCVDEWVAVGEGEIAEALVGLLEAQSKLVEGAAAVALAAFKRLAPRLAGQTVVVVCCGGNIALPTLRRAIDMARLLPPTPPPAAPVHDGGC